MMPAFDRQPARRCQRLAHRKAAQRRRSAGFSLIELMMALLVGAIVLTGVFAFSGIQQSTASMQRRQLRVQHALEGAMWTMSRDVRLAGFGFTRQCSEIRIWAPDLTSPSGGSGRLVNPGAADQGANLANDVAVDPMTLEPYWVLRDGIQAHWRSSGGNNGSVDTTNIAGNSVSSAAAASAADSFDVVLAERNMAQPSGLFRVAGLDATPPASSSSASLLVEPSGLLSGSTGEAAIRQMFPPGSFVLLTKLPAADSQPFMPQQQQQCVIVQITDDVAQAGSEYRLPISNVSDFNQNLAALMGDGRPDNTAGPNSDGVPANYTGQAPFDWTESMGTSPAAWMISPLGRLRWSRYEIDYSVPGRPYLVRTDFISHVPALDAAAQYTADAEYPDCGQGEQCTLPQLHLPGGDADWADIPRVAVGPMIEDMQVAVGCDGYTVAGAQDVFNRGDTLMSEPDAGFEEKIEPGGPGLTNLRVDEWDVSQDRGQDEWLGNAVEETWGPDCVYYGTGEYRRTDWAGTGPTFERTAGPAFRMSPQLIRITLLAKPDVVAPSGNAYEAAGPAQEFYNDLFEIEDRPRAEPVAPRREYYTLTETFAPQNLRWRDSRL